LLRPDVVRIVGRNKLPAAIEILKTKQGC
jgi:hypothetical protein